MIFLDQFNEIKAGICEDLTEEEIQNMYPLVWNNRKLDKYNFEYPSGESYAQLYCRVAAAMEDIKANTLIVCHQAVARMIVAFALKKNPAEFVSFPIPLHCIITVNTLSSEVSYVYQSAYG